MNNAQVRVPSHRSGREAGARPLPLGWSIRTRLPRTGAWKVRLRAGVRSTDASLFTQGSGSGCRMSPNKKVVEFYMARRKRAEIAPLLADDAEWIEYADGVPPSGVHSKGREAWIQNFGDAEFTSEIHRMTEENNVVVVEGTARGAKKEGGFWTVRYVDVFEFESGKIKRMTSIGATVKEPR